MRLRYIGTQVLKIQVGKTIRHLQEDDEIDIDPWKIRASRLLALFEVAEEDPAQLTKADKKFLKAKRGWTDPALYTEKVKTPEEWAEEIDKEKNKE